MQGYQVKSKSFSEIMDSYFPEWKVIRSSKTKRISPSGVSIPVKLYYERQEVKEEFIEVIDSDLPEEWKRQEQLKIDTGEE